MRVLITVTTYPQPSHSYDELVCTAGILEDGSWLRSYPVPFRFLEFRKYQWIELDLIRRKRSQDFRPESYRPRKHDLSDMKVVSRLYTAQSWLERKEACLRNVYTNMTSLIAASQSPGNASLAASDLHGSKGSWQRMPNGSGNRNGSRDCGKRIS